MPRHTPALERSEGTHDPPPSRRRRGGQPGNLNALKHGRFSRQARDVKFAAEALGQFSPEVRRLVRHDQKRREQIARSLRVAADMLLGFPGETNPENTRRLIQKASRKIQNAEKQRVEATNRVQKAQERLDAAEAQTVE